MKFRFVFYIAMVIAGAALYGTYKFHRPPPPQFPEIHKYQVTPGEVFFFESPNDTPVLSGKKGTEAQTPTGDLKASVREDHIGIGHLVTGQYRNQGYEGVLGAKTSALVTVLALSPDAKTLVSGEVDGTIEFWNMSDATPGIKLNCGTPVADLAFSPDGKTLVVASTEVPTVGFTVQRWTSTGNFIDGFGKSPAEDITYATDGTLIVGFRDGTIKLGDATIETGSPVTSVDIQTSGRLLVSGHADKDVRIWDVKTKTLKYTMKPPTVPNPIFPRGIDQVLFARNEDQLCVVYADGDTRIWGIKALNKP